MYKNGSFMHEDESFVPKVFMDENSMDGNIIFMHANVIFIQEY